jgi:hypothetical protein
LRHSPPEIQRAIYDAFRLKIEYSHRRHEAKLTVTITDETADRVTRATRTSGNADLLGAPGRGHRRSATPELAGQRCLVIESTVTV